METLRRGLQLLIAGIIRHGPVRVTPPPAAFEPWWVEGKKRGKSQLRKRRRARQARRAKARASR